MNTINYVEKLPQFCSASLLQEIYEIAREAALAAGKIILNALQERGPATSILKSKTSSIDIVTHSDIKSQNAIISIIKEHFSTHKIIAEESDENKELSNDPTWIIDPIDGTTNFHHTFPYTCVSIGVLINQVYSPLHNEFFSSMIGQGAYLNNRLIAPSRDHTSLNNSLICIEFGYDRTEKGIKEFLILVEKLLSNKVQSIRALGSCALNMCNVACGRLDAYFEGKDSSTGIHSWDVAASYLIAKEAGAIVLDPSGGVFDIRSGRVFVVSNRL